MSCNHCATKFSFFHKELGCSNCGLSFCNKCLKQKSRIPSKGPGEFVVCKTCFTKLAAGSSSTQNIIVPPDAYLKRLESLENPSQPPITVYKNDKLSTLRTGLSPVDQKLLDRLEKLKDEKGKGPPPTEVELRKRLANLKGTNDYVEGPSKPILTTDTRTEQQKVDGLLEQFLSERDIELAHNPQEEIEARLASLREKGVRPNEGPYISNLHDSASSSEEEMDRISKKEEVRIMKEKYTAFKSPSSNPPPSTTLTREEIINEVFERNMRSSNIIVYGVSEQGKTKHEQIVEDTIFVENMITALGLAEEYVKPIRLGKFDRSRNAGPRPIKVRLSTADAVQHVLRKFHKLKRSSASNQYSSVNVAPDRTPAQFASYEALKLQMNKRIKRGERNLKIRYENGIPRIVSSED